MFLSRRDWAWGCVLRMQRTPEIGCVCWRGAALCTCPVVTTAAFWLVWAQCLSNHNGTRGRRTCQLTAGEAHACSQRYALVPVNRCPGGPLLQGSRYDDNIAVFGRSLQKKMEGLKVFLASAGGGVG